MDDDRSPTRRLARRATVKGEGKIDKEKLRLDSCFAVAAGSRTLEWLSRYDFTEDTFG